MMITSTHVAEYQVRNRDRQLESSVAPRRQRSADRTAGARFAGLRSLVHRSDRTADRPATTPVSAVAHTAVR